jgi:ubiquinone/menaquinone biosynthesis C-methylase UbiE
MYRFLEKPFFYNFVQTLFGFGGKRHKRLILNEILTLLVNAKLILDVGCGPLSKFSPHCLLQAPIGLDISFDYIRAYVSTHDQPSLVSSVDFLPFPDNRFDAVLSYGLFHHLDDQKARNGINEIVRVCAVGGQIIILDNVYPQMPVLKPQAYLIRRLDRGKYVRTQESLTALLPPTIHWTTKRYVYNRITQIELLFCNSIKEI